MLLVSPEYFECLSHNRHSEKAERKQDFHFWKKKKKKKKKEVKGKWSHI